METGNNEKGFAVVAVVAIAVVAVIGVTVIAWLTIKPGMPVQSPTPTAVSPKRTSDSPSGMISMTAQNNSNLDAKYQLIALGSPSGISSQTRVIISVSNSPQGVSMPAHIHTGTCANLGGIKYSLSNVVNGTSVTTVDASIVQIKMALPLAINIHKSIAESGVYVACANLNADGSLDMLYNN